MSALGIAQTQVHFKGCKNLPFMTRPDPSTGGRAREYVVTYPTEVGDNYLAPAVHELAHVMQFEAADGSLDSLRAEHQNESLRIELEADYLAGVVFKKVLEDEGVVAFQQNLTLTGMYKEKDLKAHGTPAQRTGAFRMGYHQKFDEDVPDIPTAAHHFEANLYGGIALAR